MATIDVPRLTTALATSLETGRIPDYWEFRGITENPGDRGARGIVISHADTEGVRCIEQAYLHLSERPPPIAFARAVSESIDRFAGPFQPGDLTYTHFLLHGIQLPTVAEVCRKIEDNGRIMHESHAARGRFAELYGAFRPVQAGRTLHLSMRNGVADDFHGLSLQLYDPVESWSGDFLSKAGFLLDTTHRTAYVINVQGQSPNSSMRSDSAMTRDEVRALRGRSFRELGQRLGMDPRAFVLRKVLQFCAETGIEQVRAIKPSYHPMQIGSHSGFRGNYEPVLVKAGLRDSPGPYFVL